MHTYLSKTSGVQINNDVAFVIEACVVKGGVGKGWLEGPKHLYAHQSVH